MMSEAAAAEEEAAGEAEEELKAKARADAANGAVNQMDSRGGGSVSFAEALDSVLEDEARGVEDAQGGGDRRRR